MSTIASQCVTIIDHRPTHATKRKGLQTHIHTHARTRAHKHTGSVKEHKTDIKQNIKWTSGA